MKSLLALLLVVAFAPPEAFAQANNREVRPHVVDPSGLGIKATVQITSEANQYHNFLATDNQATPSRSGCLSATVTSQSAGPGSLSYRNPSKFARRFLPSSRSSSS